MVSPLNYCHIFVTHLLSYTVPFKGTDYTNVQRLHMSKSGLMLVYDLTMEVTRKKCLKL